MADFGGVDVDGAFRDARRQLDSVRAGAGAARGAGEAADGQVRVVAAGGRLERVELDPRVMRMPGERLAGHLVEAGNAALDELRAAAPAPDDTAVDPAVLARRLEQVTEEGLRSMAVITQAIEGAMAQVADRAGMTGDPRPTGLEQLVAETRRVVPAPPPPDPSEGAEPPDPTGAGEAAEGRIRARVAPGGRIDALEIDPPALRLPSADLAEQVKAAVNGALDDMRAKAQERAGAVGPVDPQRLQQLREDSVRQMTAYAGALRDLIASVYRR
jgi:DNA-binding protein YbaB